MTDSVVLGGALRTNLLALQNTQSNIDRVQNILATGLKVSSALDNPQNFFAAQSLNNRASDLSRLLDGIGQSIQTVKAADAGVTALTSLIDQADSIASAAQEEVRGGAKQAVITGNIDLRGVSDLTDLGGITAGDELSFSYLDTDGTTVRTETVAIAGNMSIDQLVTAINDLGSSSQFTAGEVFEAKLTAQGNLQIADKAGKGFNLVFDADGGAATFSTLDQNFGNALGFSEVAKRTGSGGAFATNGNYEVTALPATKLISGSFYDATSGFADASDALTTVRDQSNGAGNARFNAGSTVDTTMRFSINATTNIDVTMEGRTIQGLVDAINNDTANNGQIVASYDATTGQFSVEALSPTVETIGVSLRSSATDDDDQAADFDFGIDDGLAITDGSAEEGETYVLASAAATLAQLELDYDTVREQIDDLVEDSGYRGVNLLNDDDLTTYFNEDRSNSLNTLGSDLTSDGLGMSAANFSTSVNIEAIRDELLEAQTSVRQFGNTIANSLSIIQTREEFTEAIVNTLEEGADKLTVADQNEEGAKLLALQTRQQLGTTSLSLAVQSQQAVLRLF